MRALWTADEIADATGGTVQGRFDADAVTFDSREVIGGELFVALKGEATDGHKFIDQAKARGARGFLVSDPVDAPHVLVTDTTAALEALGAAARERAPAIRIGVTGSAGKTGVKSAIAAALERFAPDAVHASVKSYNNHVGVPLSLARMPAGARFGVFEMGMNHAGELHALTAQVRPHVAVVTTIAPAHIEYFGSEEAIADAKGEIFAGLVSARHPGESRNQSLAARAMGPGFRRDDDGGVAIIPYDSPHRDRLIEHARPFAANIVTFGTGAGADVRAIDYALLPDCTTCTAQVGDERLTFKVGMAGRHWLSNALAVLAAVQAAGGDLALAGLALAELTGLPGRGQRFRTVSGAVIIDESYNANPASMAAALNVLAEVVPAGQGRRIALLGEMRELGEQGADFHAGLAPLILGSGAARAILVGPQMTPLVHALRRQVAVTHVDSAAQVADVLDLAADDVLLVKGSNGVGLGAVVAALREEGRP